MNTHYTYFIILAASLLGPLALSFDKKVAFYKNWKFLFPAMILPAAFYILWDMYFTLNHVWSFNAEYVTGIKIGNLPIEEILFFFVVPYCCLFIYDCLKAYFPDWRKRKAADVFFKILALLLLVTGFIFLDRYYTSWTFLFAGVFILMIYLLRSFFKSFDAFSFLVAYGICLIPFLIINGFLTAIPVVLYNDAENLGIRIYSIPFEDAFYGMLLILMNVVIYEKLKSIPESVTD